MDRFQEMAVFQAAAEEESFAAAARRLNMSPPGVTRAVAALEARIGAQLLARTTRSVRITEAGQRYLEDCRRILAELAEAEESASGAHAAPRGQLNVTAPVLFGELYITPLLVDFLVQQPAVNVRALLVDRLVNMVDEGLDVAIRIGELPDSGLQAVRVGSVRRVVCAAPDFIARHGKPDHPHALQRAELVGSSSSVLLSEWRFETPEGPLSFRPEPRLVLSSIQASIQAALLGGGFIRVLSYQVASHLASGALVRVLEDFEPAALPIHVVYQGGARVPARVRSFVDFCAERLRADPALNPPAGG